MNESLKRLEALKEAFDHSFAAPPPAARSDFERLVGVRVGVERQAFAFRLTDLSGLSALPALVPLPGAPAACLGVAGVRGRLVPVFDLGLMLGLSSAPARWVVLGPVEEPVAFAISELDGYFEAPHDTLQAALAASPDDPVHAVWRHDVARGILHLPTLLAPLRRIARVNHP
jgi:purine-binding chemotaxis protein CheW